MTPPTADPAGSDPTQEILRGIRRIIRTVDLRSRQLFRQSGLTLPQLLCLRAIQEGEIGSTTAAAIARRVQLSPATVTGILDRLEREQLVERLRDSADRRKICLFLTPAGLERLETLPPTFQDEAAQKLAKLSKADQGRLIGALHDLAGLLGADEVEASPLLAPQELHREGGPVQGEGSA